MAYLQHAAAQLTTATAGAAARWQAKVEHYRPLIERIIAQTEQRVLAGQPVPADDKLVSLFEPHADIIRKGREVAYGHKLNLTTGPRGLILDLVIEAGNPADSARLLPMLERHSTFYGRPPRQAAADGSYASRLQPRPLHPPQTDLTTRPPHRRPADHATTLSEGSRRRRVTGGAPSPLPRRLPIDRSSDPTLLDSPRTLWDGMGSGRTLKSRRLPAGRGAFGAHAAPRLRPRWGRRMIQLALAH